MKKKHLLYIVGTHIVGYLCLGGLAILLAKLLIPSMLSLGVSALAIGWAFSLVILVNAILLAVCFVKSPYKPISV